MIKIVSAQANHYHIRLPITLSDSTHGDMEHFEVITVRLHDADGAEGVGYTYTIGLGGTAVQAILEREILPSLIGADATDIEGIFYGGTIFDSAADSVVVEIAGLVDLLYREQNYGLEIRLGDELLDVDYVRFHAYDTADSAKVPRLKIWYTPGDVPEGTP